MALFQQDSFPRTKLDPGRQTGLILCGMGGPDGPDAVRPFLRNLFRDPSIFPAPRLIAPVLGWAIARFRSPAVRERYRLMDPGCASPQLATTRKQATALADLLTGAGHSIVPGVAMRYWHPFAEETVTRLHADGAEQYLVVPMYPQYSSATNGSTLDFVMRSLSRIQPGAPVHMLGDWSTLPGFIAALAVPAQARLQQWATAGVDPHECGLVYVAHSLPRSFIDQGDPYLERTRATVDAVHRQLESALAAGGHGGWLAEVPGGSDPVPAFQSKVGPIKWLGPEITERTAELARQGCRRLLVVPVSFTCDHIETLIELDMELKEEAAGFGVTEFVRGPALNLDPGWLESLASHLLSEAFAAEVSSHV